METIRNTQKKKGSDFRIRCARDFSKNKYIYLMLLPVLLYFIMFCYVPMYGALIAFKDYKVASGVWGSQWVGFKWFVRFFNDYTFLRVLKNTLIISAENILWGFPAPIILALLMNELTNSKFKRVVQTVTYLPHFVSMVVVCSIITAFFSRDGVVTKFFTLFGMEATNMLAVPGYFRSIYIGTGIWQTVGWGTIVYLSALTAIDPQQYEAATIEGASKFKQVLHITLPGIAPTITIMLILRVGQIMNVGYEKILLLYSPLTYETADIISTYVYRIGVLEGVQYSYSAAIGLFQSAVNLILIIVTNAVSRKISETSLW